VWVDLEMTGLDLDNDVIMEMACIVTDKDLNILDESDDLIINVTDEKLDGMGEWCQRQHGISGLTEACRRSKISLSEAERLMVDFVKNRVPLGVAPLAGNSVHVDKCFLDKYMPEFSKLLHYRIVDVSTVKELARRWYPTEYKKAPRKAGTHRAMDDIRDSINELKFYRKTVFK